MTENTEPTAKEPRRMLQPPKDVIRTALNRANNLIERLYKENADLRFQLCAMQVKDKAAFAIVFVAGGLVGAVLTMLGQASL